MKNVVKLENYYHPKELEKAIAKCTSAVGVLRVF